MGKRKTAEQAKSHVTKLLKEIDKRVSRHAMNDTTQLRELEEGLVKILDSIPKAPLDHECCMLPHHHHPVKASRRVCATDPKHIFCKRHRLDKCVVCGGELE
jgi:hypothetical protein